MSVTGVFHVDSYAEAYGTPATRLVLTADTPDWAQIAALSLAGFATSVIGCGCEAGIERSLAP